MASITKRGDGQWQARVRKRGYKPVSRTFSTKARAEQWTRLTESEMERGVFISTSEAETTTLHDLLQRYAEEVLPTKKSQSDGKYRLKLLDEHLGHLVIAAITPPVVKEYRDYRRTKVQDETVRKEVLTLGRILKVAHKEWDIHLPRGNPVESIALPKKSKARDRRLEAGEEKRLLDAALEYGGMIHDIITLALETGMRRGEIVSMRWNDVNYVKRTAVLRDTKNTEDRTVPLSPRALEILKKQPRNISGIVFAIRADSITQAFDRVCVRAEIEGLNFHDLRHEATSRFFEKGLGVMEVAAITGHKDLAMLKRYTHLRAEDIASKLAVL